MPTYAYHCKHCDRSSECVRKITDEPLKTCPHCHKDGLEKQLFAAGFHLKGSGWYMKDAAKAPAKEPTAAAEKPVEPVKKDPIS